MNRLILWLAQGFGSGRSPLAPGTFGSVVGLGWFLALHATGHLGVYLIGTGLGLAWSVWICGRAEKLLGESDPGSVVLDEIAAVPVCFLLPVGWVVWQTGEFAPWGMFYHRWPYWLLAFAAFRLFDIWKPWPVGPSQNLPGGWGVTVDDVLAALYVNLVFVWLVIGN
ncbi:MAG: phosphatidylglycerophosphatase A family protein [Limisphaerales bacterium]